MAGRLWIDQLRARRETDDVDNLPLPAATDVAHEVESRIALATTVAAMSDLRPLDRTAIRRALASARAGEASVLEDQRRRVALHKARRRLRLRLQGLVAVLVAFWWRARTRVGGRGASAAMAAGAAALAMSVMVLPMSPSGPDGGPVARTPAPRAAAQPLTAITGGAPPPAPVAMTDAARPAPLSGAAVATTAVPPRRALPPRVSGTSAAVSYPAPLGTGQVGTRPRRGDDPVACTAVDQVAAKLCVDGPTLRLPAPPAPPRVLRP